MRHETISTLVDARTGIIRRLEHRPVPDRLPVSLCHVASTLSDTTRFGPWAADTAGAGTAFWDEPAAMAAAVGEAVERYCANLVPSGLRTASYDELVAAGETAIDPRTVALYHDEQYRAPGFPFVPFTTDLRVQWVAGRHLVRHDPVWVPAALVWITYYEGSPTRDQPPTNALVHAGVAAGGDRTHAEWSALCELVERDAMTLAWLGRSPALAFAEPPAWLAELARGPQGNLWSRFLVFPSVVGLPVVGALVIDTERGYRCMGTACHPDLTQAMSKALAEAMQLQMIVGELDDPDSAFMRVAPTDGSPLKPWRGQRDYLDAYRADWRDVTHHACHLQLHLDPRMGERLEAELDGVPTISVSDAMGPDSPVGIRPLQADARADRLVEVAERLEVAGHAPVSVDVTTTDIRPTGLRVTRVTAPGLYSYAAAAFPCLGGERLARQLRGHDAGPRLLPLPH
jgi:ribosomal protein S12 methylthiotransferase accessory factor